MTLPGGAEIAAALCGLAAVLRGDPAAPSWYDLSADGFWRSFWPPLIATAAYLLLLEPSAIEISSALTGTEHDRISYMLMQAGQFLLAWFAYLAVILALCRAFQLTGRYAVFVTLYNWANGITTAVSVPVLAASQWGLLPAGTLGGWNFTLLIVWLYVVAQIARLALGAPALVAVTAAALNLAVTLVLHGMVDLIL